MKQIFILALVSITLSSCAGVGYLAGGKQTRFAGKYTLPIHKSIEASKSKLKSILLAKGFNKVSEDETTILFQNSVSTGAQVGLGKFMTSHIGLVFDSEKITLSISQFGNFKYGTEKATNETFAKIREQYNIN